MSEEVSRRFEERRLHVRYVCTSKAMCELSLRSGAHVFAVSDISGGGMRIKSPDAGVLEDFQEDASVRIVAAGDDGGRCPLEDLTGRVVWTRSEQGQVHVGIEFDSPLESRLDYLLGVLLGSGQLPVFDS
ncbi:PilZ domain-containing protein [Paucidesulfovibrio longus]|uniref:PilZ domain-containing protein n=1 Tax=Paucidesulfovibrio longus TaxID=889 RepID=UPI0003B327B9|nr:PilZ domain-containing protein [Paucidesulfovibrio longus]